MLRPLHQRGIGDQHFVPVSADDFPHTGRVFPHFHHYARRIQCLKEFCNVLLRRPQLSFRQRFSLQTQNTVMAPLVAQIHSHCQGVEIRPTRHHRPESLEKHDDTDSSEVDGIPAPPSYLKSLCGDSVPVTRLILGREELDCDDDCWNGVDKRSEHPHKSPGNHLIFQR